MSPKRDHQKTGENVWPGKGARRHGGAQQPTKAGVTTGSTTRFYDLYYQESKGGFAESCGERHPVLKLLQTNELSASGTDNGAIPGTITTTTTATNKREKNSIGWTTKA